MSKSRKRGRPRKYRKGNGRTFIAVAEPSLQAYLARTAAAEDRSKNYVGLQLMNEARTAVIRRS